MNSNQQSSTSLFIRNGTQANKWVKAFVNLGLDNIKNDFILAFDAFTDKTYGYGDIAIDESIKFVYFFNLML